MLEYFKQNKTINNFTCDFKTFPSSRELMNPFTKVYLLYFYRKWSRSFEQLLSPSMHYSIRVILKLKTIGLYSYFGARLFKDWLVLLVCAEVLLA